MGLIVAKPWAFGRENIYKTLNIKEINILEGVVVYN